MDDQKRALQLPISSGIAGTCSSDKTETATSTIIESTTTDWTDEKHSLYLNSIEESFVNQLYGHDYHLSDSYDWFSRTQKGQLPSGSKMNRTLSGQFKVQTRGCWEEIKFERTRPRADIKTGTSATTANPWIRHFRSPRAGCHRHERPCSFGTKSFPNQLPCSMKIYYQDSVCSDAEVSDQNFADNDNWDAEKEEGGTCQNKRSKITGISALGQDQVVPYKDFLISPQENSASLNQEDAVGTLSQ